MDLSGTGGLIAFCVTVIFDFDGTGGALWTLDRLVDELFDDLKKESEDQANK